MTLTSTSNFLMRRNWQNKFLGTAAAFLLAGSSAAFALTLAESEIQSHLPAGKFLLPKAGQTQATQAEIEGATKLAIANPPLNSHGAARVTTPTFVSTGVKYAPAFASDLAKAGLDRVQADFAAAKFTVATLQSYTGSIVNSAVTAAIFGSRYAKIPAFLGTVSASTGAAAVTSIAVNSVKSAPLATVYRGNTLLSVVVTNAVRSAARRGVGDVDNGAGGAVTGAISQVAGSSNADVANNDADDGRVRAVIFAATKAAPSRYLEIAKAIGYAFASTYRATTADGIEITALAFQNNNAVALRTAMVAARRFSPAQLAAINNQISAGIALAYAGLTGPGTKGVADFAYNNGNGTPVTDVTGL